MTILSNEEIKKIIKKDKLVIEAKLSNVGSACYELCMGSIYYDLTEKNKRIDSSKYGNILIKPGHRVVLITKEKLEIPSNILARVTSKGSLFSIGLSPVSTYADPGFKGNLGIVTQNFSDKYIVIPIGERIAKVDFSLLSSASTSPYQGQHGFQTEIWPIKHQLQKSYEDIRTDPRMKTEEEEASNIIPQATAQVLRKLRRKQRVIDISIIFLLVVNTTSLALLSSDFIGSFVAIIINIISSAIVGLFTWLTGSKE